MQAEQWNGFVGGKWEDEINTADFIQKNYTPYTGDQSFLAGPTKRTERLMEDVNAMLKLEQDYGGVMDIDTYTVSTLTGYKPGYINKNLELIVGLQTDRPLKRGVNPFGGIRMARQACEAYGYELSEQIENYFKYKTTHNDGVYRVYTPEMRAARKAGILTGLPDAYGRGRIIGDYRRVALYGVDRLIEQKKADKLAYGEKAMTADNIRASEELFEQIQSLQEWRRAMAWTSACRLQTQRKRFSGPTLRTSLRLRNRTVRR